MNRSFYSGIILVALLLLRNLCRIQYLQLYIVIAKHEFVLLCMWKHDKVVYLIK